MKKNRLHNGRLYLRLIPPALLLAGLISVLTRFKLSDAAGLVGGTHFRAAIILLTLYVLKSIVLFIPLSGLYISAGMLFPRPWAIGLSLAFLTVEMSLVYFNGRALGARRLQALLQKSRRMSRLTSISQRQSSTLCLLARLSPLSFDLVSLFYGASCFSYSRFIVFSILGEIPRMLPYILAGKGAYAPLSVGFLLPLGLALSSSLLLVAISARLLGRDQPSAPQPLAGGGRLPPVR